MKTSIRRALCVYGFALGFFAVSILFATARMPTRVASHFNGAGVANGWSNRADFELRFSLISIFVALFPVGLCYLTRFMSPEFLNVPNAGYWRSPVNYPIAAAVVFGRSIWLAAGLTLWAAGFNWAVIEANVTVPPHLTFVGWALPTVILLIFVISWGISLARYFAHPPVSH